MNLKFFIYSLSKEEIEKLKELLNVGLEEKIPTFLELYEKTRDSDHYGDKILSYNRRVEEKRKVSELNCSGCGALHYLDVREVPTTIVDQESLRTLHLNLIHVPSIGKKTIDSIENWFKFYQEEFLERQED